MPKKDHLFKPGVSGNAKGRPKGSRNKYQATVAQLKQLDDLALTREFLRAVLTNDSKVLANLGITETPSIPSKISAAKELSKVNEEIVNKQKAEREQLEQQAKQRLVDASKETLARPTFVTKASVEPIKKLGNQ